MRRVVRAGLFSVLVGCLVLALKFTAYWLTGSIALYSDALESVINVVAALAATIAVWLSAQPADENHPYGHQKVEYFSAGLEGALIVLAAVMILREAFLAFPDPKPLAAPVPGLILNVAATVLNGVWAVVLIRWSARWKSPALAADGRHILADVATSLGVVAGLVLVPVTGWLVLDPLLASLVAIHILWAGYGLIRQSVGVLMDEAAPEAVRESIAAIVAEEAHGALQAHDLRTRHAGHVTFIDFHLVVPGDMRVAEAHAICDRIEQRLEADMGGTQVSIHVEPEHKTTEGGLDLT